MDGQGAGLRRQDGTEVSPQYLEAVRRDARREAEAAARGEPSTLAAAFDAHGRREDATSWAGPPAVDAACAVGHTPIRLTGEG